MNYQMKKYKKMSINQVQNYCFQNSIKKTMLKQLYFLSVLSQKQKNFIKILN